MKCLMIFATVVAAVLFGMKLAGTIVCTWLVVFTPLIIAFGIWLAIVILSLAIIVVCVVIAILMNDD